MTRARAAQPPAGGGRPRRVLARHRSPGIGAWLARAAWCLWVACVLVSMSTARAHDRRLGRLTVVAEPSGATLDVELRALDVTAVQASVGPGRGRALGDFLVRHVRLERGGAACRVALDPDPNAGPRGASADAAYVRVALRAACPRTGPLVVESRVHESLVGFAFAARVVDGPHRSEGMLAEGAERLPRPDAAALPAFAALRLGATHLATGADHLALLLVLLLASRGLRDAALAITGFTAGHALSLGLVATGRMHVDAPAAEVLIVASVALSAVSLARVHAVATSSDLVRSFAGASALVFGSLAWLSPVEPSTVLVALGAGIFAAAHRRVDTAARGFVATVAVGLVHGLGFAGALVERLDAPPPLATLLAFNVGIELTQLALAGVVWPVWAAWRRSPERAAGARTVVGTAVAAAAGYWWIGRLVTGD